MLKHLEEEQKTLEKASAIETIELSRLNDVLSTLSGRYGLTQDELLRMIAKRKDYTSIPVSIFNNILSPLENVVCYLYIKLEFSQTKIANLLKRDHTTIWTTIKKGLTKINRSKYKQLISNLNEGYLVPLQSLSDRKLSILESVSIYMKDKFNLSYHEIATILGKNDRTIWTVINRAKKKMNTIS